MSSFLEILFLDFSPWSLMELKCAECRIYMFDFIMVRLLTKKAMKMEILSLKISFLPCKGAFVVVIFVQKKVICRNIHFISIVRLIIELFLRWVEVDIELDCAKCKIFIWTFVKFTSLILKSHQDRDIFI